MTPSYDHAGHTPSALAGVHPPVGSVMMDDMTLPGIAPRSGLGGIIAVWIAAAVIAIAIGIFAPPEWRGAWMSIGLAASIVLSFVVQLVRGHSEGFLRRVAASALGAFVIVGLIGLGLGLASLFA